MSVEALALDVVVLQDGVVVETYPQCSPLDVQGWNAQLAANYSRMTVVPSSVPAPTLDPTAWPANVDAQYLLGGPDGTRMLGTSDVLGALATLAQISEPTLVAIPDAYAPASAGTFTLPPVSPPPPVVKTLSGFTRTRKRSRRLRPRRCRRLRLWKADPDSTTQRRR